MMMDRVFRSGLILSVLVLLGVIAADSPATASVLRTSGGGPVPSTVELVTGRHIRILTSQAVIRVAVGDSDIAATELLTGRELLILGRKPGSTSVTLWFRGGRSESRLVLVKRDLSVLASALSEIYPGISVESAPDRDAVVLRGTVPDVSFSRAAEDAARSYLGSGSRRNNESSSFLIASPDGSTRAPADTGSTTDSIRVGEAITRSEVAVINLLRLETLPPLAEQKVEQAIQEIGGDRVRVSRLQREDVPNDDVDVLLLEGTVDTQVTLTRVLNVAAKLFVGAELSNRDAIRALTDEAGALIGGRGQLDQQVQQSSGLGGSNVFGGAGSSSLRGLRNRIQSNVARARAIELANGRILSFIEVEELPQVRVEAQIYEVNRTKLREYQPEFLGTITDFPTNSTVSGTTDVQQILGFLAGGFASQTSIVGQRFSLDALFNYLETQGLAKRLSSPTLTVLSGELAEFQVGGEVPISTSFTPAFGGDTAETPGVFNTITFRPFGVQLGVRPLVGDYDTVVLDVTPQVIVPDALLTSLIRETTGTELQTTAFQTRGLRTTTRLEDGQQLMMGGLLSRDLTTDSSSTPGLRSVPGLSALVSEFNRREEDSELVLLVSASIVREPLEGRGLWQFPSSADMLRSSLRSEAQ